MRAQPLAEVVRSGFVESVHTGVLVTLDADGRTSCAVGDVDAAIYPRSANKPLQSAGMVRAGLPLHGELLALASASHSGEPFHLEGARAILAGAGLTEADLQTPPDWPVDEQEKVAYLRAGGEPTPLAMNCSGKHAAMLATAVANGWPTETYRRPDHPLQLALRATIEELAGEEVAHTGMDGCGAPLFALSVLGLARAFRAVALAPPGTAEHRVATAIRTHPAYVGGTRRDVTRLIEGVPGIIAKDGADGVYAAAMPDGRAVAFKIADGGQRARPPVMAAALRRVGVQAPVLDELATVPVLGHGEVVGEIRAVLPG